MSRTTGRPWRRTVRAVVAGLIAGLLGASVGVVSTVDVALADSHCVPPSYPDSSGNCIVPVGGGRPPSSVPGGSGNGDPGPSGPIGGGGDVPPPCPDWRLIGVDGPGPGIDYPAPDNLRPSSWNDAPEGSSFYYDACSSPNGFGPGSTTMWAPPGAPAPAPAPPTPAEVAEGLWVDVRQTLLRPTLVTSPDQGEWAVLHVPTFVAVSNWQGEISRSRCELGVCVSLVAEPTLELDPGEPEAPVIECDPPGTYFDPEGADPDEQAEGACAYAYQHHTVGGGRPEAWLGEVRVVWDVRWQETGGGTSGTFDLTLSTELERSVGEVPTVVASVDDRA